MLALKFVILFLYAHKLSYTTFNANMKYVLWSRLALCFSWTAASVSNSRYRATSPAGSWCPPQASIFPPWLCGCCSSTARSAKRGGACPCREHDVSGQAYDEQVQTASKGSLVWRLGKEANKQKTESWSVWFRGVVLTFLMLSLGQLFLTRFSNLDEAQEHFL